MKTFNRRSILKLFTLTPFAMPALAVALSKPRIKDVGWVTWCYTPPHNVSWQVHKFSVLDAFDLAAKFVKVNEPDAKPHLVVGQRMASIVAILPQFFSDKISRVYSNCYGQLSIEPKLTGKLAIGEVVAQLRPGPKVRWPIQYDDSIIDGLADQPEPHWIKVKPNAYMMGTETRVPIYIVTYDNLL